jgi:non-ribosomal peptide synthetase component F
MVDVLGGVGRELVLAGWNERLVGGVESTVVGLVADRVVAGRGVVAVVGGGVRLAVVEVDVAENRLARLRVAGGVGPGSVVGVVKQRGLEVVV